MMKLASIRVISWYFIRSR